jgi:hypothetical protein
MSKPVAPVHPMSRPAASRFTTGLTHGAPGSTPRSFVEFFLQSVAISDVQALKLLELDQQFSGPGCVVTITFQARNKRTLPGDVLLSLGDMALGQRQMLQYGGSIWQATRITREGRPPFRRRAYRASAPIWWFDLASDTNNAGGRPPFRRRAYQGHCPTAAPLRAISARHIL